MTTNDNRSRGGRYVTGHSIDPGAEFVFVQYRGHTLQGSYEGGFVYSRKPFLAASAKPRVAKVARVSARVLAFDTLRCAFALARCVCESPLSPFVSCFPPLKSFENSAVVSVYNVDKRENQ